MIRLENFSIQDDLGRQLITDVNLFIPSGSIILVKGNHSTGKTMLSRVIGLIDNPTKGNLYLLGKNVKKLNRTELSDMHSEIGVVFQENNFVKNFYSSPRLELLDYQIKSNSLEIIFKETDNKNYWLVMNKCIKDLNEGNVLDELNCKLFEN